LLLKGKTEELFYPYLSIFTDKVRVLKPTKQAMSTHACLCVYARRQGDRRLPCCRQVGGYILGRTSASARRRAAEKIRGAE